MLFNSLLFIFVFMPLTLWGAMRCRGQSLLRWITLSSFTFYALAGQTWFLIPMLVTTVLDYFLAQMIEKSSRPRRRWLLLLSLCGNLGLLIYFKYSRLILGSVNWTWHLGAATPAPAWFRIFDVVLPAGISFYTFQTLSYIIDVYKGSARAETNFWEFAAFVSFFPHLVAGPLTRHHQLIPQLKRLRREGFTPRWEEGILLFAVGLCKKTLLADRIGDIIDPLLGNIGSSGMAIGWLALFGYSLQIYFDFSGYSDMAIGVARLFGIELPQNFNSPYQALNPTDFWRRWHITLSQWLRDYLYIPLGGNRDGLSAGLRNLLITMFLGGLWHGAHWTFAIWGLYHGSLLALYHLTRPRWDRQPIWLQRAMTYLLVCLGWIPFRATSYHQAHQWLQAMSRAGEFTGGFGGRNAILLTMLVGGGVAISQSLPNASHFEHYREFPVHRQVALGFLCAASVFLMNYSSKFLYFQF